MAESSPKWAPIVAGVSFAGIGLFGLVSSIPNYGDFAVQSRTEYRDYQGGAGTDLPGGKSFVRVDGFDAGGTALFCMFVFSVGVGITASPFLGTTGRQNMCLLIAALWHSLGIGTLLCYLKLAPHVYAAWPFVAICVFEGPGPLPLALGVRRWFKKSPRAEAQKWS